MTLRAIAHPLAKPTGQCNQDITLRAVGLFSAQLTVWTLCVIIYTC